jgi:hypothetical protein
MIWRNSSSRLVTNYGLKELASQVERTDDFSQLENELLPLGLGHESLIMSRAGRTFRTSRTEIQPIVPLSEVFNRLGLYHDILANVPSQAIWERLEAALKSEPREITTLFLLRGCDFPRECRIFNVSVRRMTDESWLKLD